MPVWDIDREASETNDAKMPSGRHHVSISKVVTEGKNGVWKTKAGDRQIMVVFCDDTGAEAVQFYPVEGRARWRLSRLMHGIGLRTKDLELSNLLPDDLLVSSIADQWLKGRELMVDVVLKDNGYHDVEVLDAEPPKPAPAKATAPKADEDDDGADEDIPF